jgi:sigma-E factor negative regulatory protein RseB
MLLAFVMPACCLSLAAPAADPCPELDPPLYRVLEAMTSTAHCGDYRGVVTLRRGNDMQVMEITHRVQDGQATEVLARLTGQDGQILRDAYPTHCLHPGQTLLRSRVASGGEGGICDLALSYRFDLGPGERIAGREALRLRAEPRDMYRFGYVFELDADTALVLKATTLGADTRVLEEFQFASLTMEDGPPAGAGGEHRVPDPEPREQPQRPDGPAWGVGWLPSGFVATEAASDAAQRKSYSDGLATFSIFLEPLGVAIKPGEGVERQGSTVAYTRGVRLRDQPMLITVLGEIPTNTARMVADSVRLR